MRRNRFIDVLKGILIILVIIYHFPFEAETYQNPFFALRNYVIPSFMMISGYVAALSMEKRGIQSLEEAYRPGVMAEKMIRYVLPYTIAFAAEQIVFRIFGIYKTGILEYGLLATVMDYLSGGKGPGSYYYPMMIQFLFLFPVVYFVVKKNGLAGLIGIFFANGFYEMLKNAFGMSEVEYRLLVVRYLFVIAAGCYLAVAEITKDGRHILLAMGSILLGGFSFYLFSYTDYQPKILIYWKSTSFLVSLLLIPILGFLIKKLHLRFKPLELVGKSSFCIFLVQMIYYCFTAKLETIFPNWEIFLIFSVLNCVVAGILFYCVDEPINRILTGIVRTFYRQSGQKDEKNK